MNAADHRLGGALVVGAASIAVCQKPEDVLPQAAIASAGGYVLSGLPDLLEPPTSPHHRQFFHSVAFVFLLGYGLVKLYQWEPDTPVGKLCRGVGLIAGAAYLGHLAVDATTKRSLPLLGRI